MKTNIQSALLFIRDAIVSYAKREDNELKRLCSKGIFFMPEIAFAFGVGKEIYRNRSHIFNGLNLEWKREETLGNTGPIDLVFKIDGNYCIPIEFKIRQTSDAYISDVRKLIALYTQKCFPVFCALVDAFEDNVTFDSRITLLEKEFNNNLTRLGDIESFSTWNDRYKKPIRCEIGVWQIDAGVRAINGVKHGN
ncbi:MAG: hypothetical protein AB1600_08195 [Bacteroidota bacterium]